MKRGIIFIIDTLMTINTFANVNFIDISKISSDIKFVTAFNYIKENQEYYDHWTNEWGYDKPKEELIKKLQDNYSTFSSITTKNEELYLLLGDIAHYLYNLDDTAFYSLAVNNYNSAIKNNPKDYRTYWFLGYHYALSNVPTQAIDNFFKAQELLPSEQPADFWNEYAWATAVTNMPSHCIFAMDKVKSILGKAGSFETQLGQTIYKRIVELDKDSSYSKQNIWTASEGEKTTFTSRPLGIKILIDSTWDLSVYDYSNHQTAFIINPPTLLNKKGKEIHYTVAILMKVANDNDKLDSYINNFVSNYSNKSKISFSDKYDNMIVYEIKDKTMYPDIGGGHLYMIGIERNAPKYPGLLLENPATLPKGNSDQVTFYTVSDSKDRFKGKIFYAIMLDSCEDIHEQSFAIFKTLFDNQIIIE
jgi:tetratricopeptide (TPR) repeat protein